MRQRRCRESGSSIQFGWPGAHPLAVEAVPAVQAHRERVVAELPVEQPVDPPNDTLADADVDRHEIRRGSSTRPRTRGAQSAPSLAARAAR